LEDGAAGSAPPATCDDAAAGVLSWDGFHAVRLALPCADISTPCR